MVLSSALYHKTYSSHYNHQNRLSDAVSKIVVSRNSNFDACELHVIASNCSGTEIIQK